jgi:hypothetical protein
VLCGALDALQSSILAVRAEVVFTPVYKDAAAFGDVHKLLIENGYELLNFDCCGAGSKGGRFSLPGRYGKLISTDAVWMVNNEHLFSTCAFNRSVQHRLQSIGWPVRPEHWPTQNSTSVRRGLSAGR